MQKKVHCGIIKKENGVIDLQEQGIYYFHQGTNYESYELLGAHYTKEETIFRVWAPNAKAVSVVGDFNYWNVESHKMNKISNEGLYEIVIPNVHLYDCYQYAIVTKQGNMQYKSDPYAFHSELRPSKASKVYDLNQYQFTDDAWMKHRKEKQHYHSPINIYEVHLGSWRRYTDGKVFDYRKLGEELSEYALQMGYTHLEILPISEYPYDPSWGYQVTGYYSITSRYGTPCDFMEFVNICHNKGIGVILDWVPGHFTKDQHGLIDFDGESVYEHPDELRKENKDWGTRCFDYGRCEVQSFLVSNAMFFVKKFHIDGIRMDAVASMLYLDYGKQEGQWRPNSYGGNINLEAVAFIKKCNDAIHQIYPEVLMIAEESTAYPKITVPTQYDGLGFDYKWNMGWMNDSLAYIKEDPIYRQYHHPKLTFQMTYIYSEHYILPLSHDEVVHMKGSLINKMPGSYEQKFAGLKVYMTYLMTHPGKKLLFMGGEIGQFREWNESNELDWSVLQYDTHKGLQQYNAKLNHLYQEEKTLYANDYNWEGFRWLVVDDASHNVLSYERRDDENSFIVVLNFSFSMWFDYSISHLENGEYQVILASDDKKYGGTHEMENTIYQVENHVLTISIPYSSGIILRKVK